MGIPVELVSEGTDWPSWVQAVGSLIAIAIAIWIDRGSERRLLSQEERSRAQAISDWEACLFEVVKLAANATRIADNEKNQTFDDTLSARLIDNAIMMIDAYLRQPPPNPKLAFALAAARSYLEVPRQAIRRRRKLPLDMPSVRLNSLEGVRSSLLAASENLEALAQEYRQGLY